MTSPTYRRARSGAQQLAAITSSVQASLAAGESREQIVARLVEATGLAPEVAAIAVDLAPRATGAVRKRRRPTGKRST